MKGLHGANRGFTLVELLVVIMIIGALAGLILPALRTPYDRLYRAQCMNNLSQIGKFAVSYADDHRGFLPFPKGIDEPRAHEIFQVLVDSIEDARRPELFVCPASLQERAELQDRKTRRFDLSEDTVSYTWRREKTRLSAIPAWSILSTDKLIADGTREFPQNHRGGLTALLADGSVQWLSLEELELSSPGDLEDFFEEHALTD